MSKRGVLQIGKRKKEKRKVNEQIFDMLYKVAHVTENT